MSATFSSAQFGAGLISNSLAVDGDSSGGTDIIINMVSNGTFTASDWTFTTWTTGGADDIFINGTSGNENITGSSVADTITGSGGADIINAGGGDDLINIANGDFVAGEAIDGGSGTDTLSLTTGGDTTQNLTAGTITGVENIVTTDGGLGNDDQTLNISAANWAGVTSFSMNDGTDVLNAVVSGAVNISALGTPTTFNSIDVRNLQGTAGSDDTITLTGTQLNAMIEGTGASINMGTGADTISLTTTSSDMNALADGNMLGVEVVSAATSTGVTINLANQSENMTVIGNSGADVISTGTNDNTITGGLGADTITLNTGASSNNVLVYNSASELTAASRDTISNFNGNSGSTDVIDVRPLLGATDLTWANTTAGGANSLWYVAGATTLVRADTTGDGVADLEIGLAGNLTLTASNFLGVSTNTAPTTTDDSRTINEDATTVLALSDFGTYSDPEGTPIASVKITTLENNGSLEYNTTGSTWVAVTQDQVITAADINAGKLRFVPDGNENGSPYTTVGFQVSDGVLFSTSHILTINVTAVDDAFTDANEFVNTNEDTPLSGSVLTGTTSVDGPVTVTTFTVAGDVDGLQRGPDGHHCGRRHAAHQRQRQLHLHADGQLQRTGAGCDLHSDRRFGDGRPRR